MIASIASPDLELPIPIIAPPVPVAFVAFWLDTPEPAVPVPVVPLPVVAPGKPVLPVVLPEVVDPAPLMVEPKLPVELEPNALELPLAILELPNPELFAPTALVPLVVPVVAPPVVLARLLADPNPACNPGRS